MSDINSEITKWIAIAKGDLPGHPFHGNQYREGSGSIAIRANERQFSHSGTGNAVNHSQIATEHLAFAEKLRRDGHSDVANAHEDAAHQHNLASASHARLAVIENRGRASSNGPTMSKARSEAKNATARAASASYYADLLTRQI